MDPITLGTAIVSAITPFTPYLLNIASSTIKSLSQKIAEEGGEKAWELAKSLWEKIEEELDQDGEVKDAASMVARKPDDQNRQALLIEVLAPILKENPIVADDLVKLLGGQESIQKITAQNESLIQDVTQRMKGNGKQLIEASDKSTIRGAIQIKDK